MTNQPGAAAGAPAIEAHDLVKTYPGGVRALDGLSISVEPGTIFGLLGPNGAGKSTTVKILTTLSRPDSGTAHVAGFDVLREPDRVRRVIGTVSQKPAIDVEATGRENMVLHGRVYGMGGRELARRIDELLDRFALHEAADRIVRTYSGGMQRKLDVAMGLVHRPSVLFLDEPTTGLDPEARAELWAEIGRLTREDGLSILLTTHYLEEADRLARRLAIVDQGRIVATGTPEELKAELHGDAIVVELREPARNGDATARPCRRSRAERADGGRPDAARPGRARRDRPSPRCSVPSMPPGLGVASVTVARPSLDDVYLRHTGRAYRAESQEATR